MVAGPVWRRRLCGPRHPRDEVQLADDPGHLSLHPRPAEAGPGPGEGVRGGGEIISEVRTERGRSLADILHLLTVMTLAALHSELYPLPLLINYVDVIAS